MQSAHERIYVSQCETQESPLPSASSVCGCQSLSLTLIALEPCHEPLSREMTLDLGYPRIESDILTYGTLTILLLCKI